MACDFRTNAIITEPRFTMRGNASRPSFADLPIARPCCGMMEKACGPRGEADDDQACCTSCGGRHWLCDCDGDGAGRRRRLSDASHYHGGTAGAGRLNRYA